MPLPEVWQTCLRRSCLVVAAACLALLPARGAPDPASTSPLIVVDQFGYRPNAAKVAVLIDPVQGFNAAQSYAPGPMLEVRRWSDDVVVYSAAPTPWNGGQTHGDSGDRASWFDFSPVTEPGRYYVWDPARAAGSGAFEVAEDVYRAVAIQAVRSFFYQRCAQEKRPPHVPERWQDAASFLGDNQDPKCRLVTDPGNPATERDLRGGWYDAGDYNKYVPFARGTVQDLLLAYEENPDAWGDDHAIPESGNGIPDLLDEIRWELDWLLRMQQPDGSLLSKVAVTQFQAGSPPSTATAPRFYGPASTTATLTGADLFAHAAVVFRNVGHPEAYAFAEVLQLAAVRAWDWAQANPAVAYENVGFASVNPDNVTTARGRAVSRARAAVKLFAATGEARFRDAFDAEYRQAQLFENPYYLSPYDTDTHSALLYYLHLDGGTASVKQDIRETFQRALRDLGDFRSAYTNAVDPYRAYLGGGDYTWGSNSTKAKKGGMFLWMLRANLDPANAATYRNAANGFLNYLHGVNPLGVVYVSNMGEFGAERSVTEFYHSWFSDGTVYDSSVSSPNGPAPGFLTGGPNRYYAPDGSYSGPRIAPPLDQPPLKAYRDWNTSWPENSWEITENGIYYQAAYIRLLAAFLDDRSPSKAKLVNLSTRARAGQGEATAIPGFVLVGQGTARMLLRAAGPGVAAQGVAGALTDPGFELVRTAAVPPDAMGSNDDWGDAPDPAGLASAFESTGAFPFPAGSADAAMVADLPQGPYTALVDTGGAESGIVLVEAYDARTGTEEGPRLANLACRARVGTGDDVLIAGVVVGGSGFKTLLVRALGPALGNLGVTGFLPNPQITVFTGASPLQSNDDWGQAANYAATAHASSAVGAYGIGSGGRDAAMLVRMPPGPFTVICSGGADAPSGVALLEVFAVD